MRQGEMSDRLLRGSLEKVFSSSHTSMKESCGGHQEEVGRATAFGGAGQRRVCQRWKSELLQERNSERICGRVLVVSES